MEKSNGRERNGLIKLHDIGWKMRKSGYESVEGDPESECYYLEFNRGNDHVTLYFFNSWEEQAAKNATFVFDNYEPDTCEVISNNFHTVALSLTDIDTFRYFLNRLIGYTAKEVYEIICKINEELSRCPWW